MNATVVVAVKVSEYKMNNVQLLFPTPVFIHQLEGKELDDVQSQIDSKINQIKQSKQISPWGDNLTTTFDFQGCNDLVKFNLTNLLNIISEQSEKFCKDIGYDNPKFKLIESWFNFTTQNGYQYDHSHPLSRLSGIYYYSTTIEDGGTRFRDPNPITHFAGWPYDKLGRDSVLSEPKVGKLILFPSWLVHRVDKNNTQNERITIAFNLA